LTGLRHARIIAGMPATGQDRTRLRHAPARAAAGLSAVLIPACLLFAAAGATTPPAGGSETALPAAAPASAAPAPTPKESPLTAEDGHAFKADYYRPVGGVNLPAILLIPNLGRDRKDPATTAARLAQAGYSVLVMDNLAAQRNVHRDSKGVPRVEAIRAPILDQMLLDLRPAADLARRKAGGETVPLVVVGVGLGANAGLQYAAETRTVMAAAFLLPGYGCENFDPKALLARLGTRPALLVDSRSKKPSDFSVTFDTFGASHTNRGYRHVVIEPSARPEGVSELVAHPEIENALFDWLALVFGPAAPR
jgi:alpha-beta hydrolase superfamily lysophospholipase